MLHFIFIFNSLFASTSAFITRPLQEPGQSCDYRALHVPSKERIDGKSDPSLWTPEPSGGLIPNTRRAALVFKKSSPSSVSYDEHQKDIWPCFDNTPELSLPNYVLPSYSSPLELLTIIYTPSICHPFDRQKIWQENFENAHKLQTIERLLAQRDKSGIARPILLQLYAVGSLMLAGISKTMHDKLDLLFQDMKYQLHQFYLDHDANKIYAPKKSCFLDKMHSCQTPFQFIGVFAHITRWLIKYRNNLKLPPRDTRLQANIQKLHQILTHQVNDLLSPSGIDKPIQSPLPQNLSGPFLTDCCTAAWIPDEFIKIFTDFALTQSRRDCQFYELVQHYENLASEAITPTQANPLAL